MGVKLRERPGKGWYVLTDYRGQREPFKGVPQPALLAARTLLTH